MIDVTKIPIEVHDGPQPIPAPPTQVEFDAEVQRLQWLILHPYASDEIRQFATVVLGVLSWTKRGHGVEPPSAFLTQGLVDEIGVIVGCCHVCGCTTDYSCPGGCAWSDRPGICTACSQKQP